MDETLAEKLVAILEGTLLEKEAIQKALKQMNFKYSADIIKCFEEIL